MMKKQVRKPKNIRTKRAIFTTDQHKKNSQSSKSQQNK